MTKEQKERVDNTCGAVFVVTLVTTLVCGVLYLLATALKCGLPACG